MRAIIVERALAGELAPLLERRPAALLPLANRPLLDLHLQALAAVGVSRLDLYLQSGPGLVREHVRSGERWGVSVHCHSVRRAEACLAPGAVWTPGAEPVISLALDMLWSAVALARQLGQLPAGLTRLAGDAGEALPMFVWQPGAETAPAVARRAAAGWRMIDGAQAYADANRQILRTLDETAHLERNFPNGLYLAAGARLDDSARISGPALIGAAARIEGAVSIGADTVVGAGCVIDHGAEIEGCVVFGDTYVGPSVLLRDKIVDGGWLIDIQTGQASYIDDPLLLGACARSSRVPSLPNRAVHWLAAALAALLALVPVLLWAGWQGARGRDAFVRELRYVAGGRDLSGRVVPRGLRLWSLASGHAGWRRLLWLLEVLRGRLALLGVARPPREAEALQGTASGYAMLALPELALLGEVGGLAELLQNERGAALRALRSLVTGLVRRDARQGRAM